MFRTGEKFFYLNTKLSSLIKLFVETRMDDKKENIEFLIAVYPTTDYYHDQLVVTSTTPRNNSNGSTEIQFCWSDWIKVNLLNCEVLYVIRKLSSSTRPLLMIGTNIMIRNGKFHSRRHSRIREHRQERQTQVHFTVTLLTSSL